MGAIYRILNVATDDFYVGSTVNVRRRRWEHWSLLKKGTHHCKQLQAAWTAYGEDAFEFEILEEVADDQLQHIEETYLMKHAALPHCYNTAQSSLQSSAALQSVRDKIGDSLRHKYATDPTYQPRVGAKHSAETRAKISSKVQRALAQGRGGKFIPNAETRQRMSQSLAGNQNAKGHVRTEEHRRKLSEAVKGNTNFLGKHHTEEAKTKLRKGVVEVTTGREFESLTDTLTHYGLKMPTLRRALLTGKPLTKGPCKGLSFQYL